MGLAPVPKLISATSPASASTALSSTIYGLAAFDSITVFAKLQGATGGTLDVVLQGSFDDGVTWYEVCRFAQLAAAAAQRTYRVNFALTNDVSQVGEGTAGSAGTAVITAGAVIPGHPGDMLRAVFIAGASTSAGAAQTIKVFGVNARR